MEWVELFILNAWWYRDVWSRDNIHRKINRTNTGLNGIRTHDLDPRNDDDDDDDDDDWCSTATFVHKLGQMSRATSNSNGASWKMKHPSDMPTPRLNGVKQNTIVFTIEMNRDQQILRLPPSSARDIRTARTNIVFTLVQKQKPTI